MATGGPAGAHSEESGVVRVADVNLARQSAGLLLLGVATEAKVWVVGDEQLFVDGTVRIMTNRAAFAECFVFKDDGPRLRLVTLRATLILPRHGQAAFRLEDVAAVRIVAIHAIHVAFHNRMMLRQIEFSLHIEMALKTGRGIFSGIDDEANSAATPDMFAAWTVTGFTAALALHGGAFDLQPRVRAGREFADDVRVAIRARLVADVVRPGDIERGHDGGRTGGARNQKGRKTDGNDNYGVKTLAMAMFRQFA
jgi:hypothetical protein